MKNLIEHAAFVNEQAAFHERQAVKYTSEPKRATMHSSSAAKFRALAASLAEIIERERLQSERQAQGIGVAWNELDGLPDELIAELSISESDRAEFNLMNLLEQSGGIASIDKLLIALYKQSGEITKRSLLTARLYRMANKGLIFPVPSKKGVYSLERMEAPESEPREAELIVDEPPVVEPPLVEPVRRLRFRYAPVTVERRERKE